MNISPNSMIFFLNTRIQQIQFLVFGFLFQGKFPKKLISILANSLPFACWKMEGPINKPAKSQVCCHTWVRIRLTRARASFPRASSSSFWISPGRVGICWPGSGRWGRRGPSPRHGDPSPSTRSWRCGSFCGQSCQERIVCLKRDTTTF